MGNAVGIICEVSGIPPAVATGDAPDGRRINFRTAEEIDPEAVPEFGSCCRVSYEGRHGHPPVILWYPEAACEDIRPPSEIRQLLMELESTGTAESEAPEDQGNCASRG